MSELYNKGRAKQTAGSTVTKADANSSAAEPCREKRKKQLKPAFLVWPSGLSWSVLAGSPAWTGWKTVLGWFKLLVLDL